MGFFRSVGKGIGTLSGGVIGGGVKLAGKAVKSEWVEEVGDGIKQASTVALDNAGQYIDGAVKGTYGAIKKDDFILQEGLDDLKDAAGRTFNGVKTTVTYTAKSAGATYEGIRLGDKEQAVQGVKNIGKVAAIATLAVGVLDLMDGVDTVDAEELETRNDHLAGDHHPVTGVPFEEKTVELPDGEFTGTFPVFDAAYEVNLPNDLYLQSDSVHFSYANIELYDELQSNPDLVKELQLTNTDIQQLAQGDTPEGYSWHHHEDAGVLQLVEEEIHHQTGHTGGRELWGGGAEYR
ncbi:HNH endonuclease [Siminovitchia sediminis]|uniref:HNH endonuclease n=1 Tax=Siminovitchia sediminis TaxID=1274353 RepID=A0ABW4KKX4_9BACI